MLVLFFSTLPSLFHPAAICLFNTSQVLHNQVVTYDIAAFVISNFCRGIHGFSADANDSTAQDFLP